MTKFEDNISPYLSFVEHVDPSNPSAGRQRLFVDTDHLLKMVDSSGTVTTFGTGLTDPMTTRGDIIIRNASNVTARLGRGSATQVLTSDGTDISWQTPAGGGGGALALLSTTTLGSDTASVTVSGISGSYKDLVVVAKLRGTAAAATIDSWVRVGNSSVDTGSNYATNSQFGGSAGGSSGGSNQTKLYTGPQVAASATAGLFGSIRLEIMDYAATSVPRFIVGNGMQAGSASSFHYCVFHAMWFNTSAAIDVISFFPDSGNYLTGSRVYVYGRG